MSAASDFRSDTVTRPTAAMRHAMANAEVGDDVLDGDPTVRALEARGAEWLGKEGALFLPSGTMANQVALGAWTRPGEEVVAEQDAHVVRFEAGAAGALHGVQLTTLRGERGQMDLEELSGVLRKGSLHEPRTALVCVEQTHMVSGGRVLPFEHLAALGSLVHESGARVHMDGARLANAVVASGVPAERWGRVADSVSFALSKGLGAPVGSLLAGPADFLERARHLRKRFGGAMRQAGVLAAAGLIALRDHLDRLAEDHALARRLAEVANAFPGLSAAPAEVETNLVLVEVRDARWNAGTLARALGEDGLRVLPLGPRTLRFVTHLDVGPADLERLSAALARHLAPI